MVATPSHQLNLIRQIGESTWSWVRNHRGDFEMPPNADDGQTVTCLKPLGELALTIDVLDRFGVAAEFGSDRGELLNLLAWCWQQVNAQGVLSRLITTYPDLFALCTVYPPFFKFGHRDQVFEAHLQSLARIAAVAAIEFPAWRALDIATSLNALNVAHNWSVAEEFESSWLAKTPEPWGLSEASAYSLTHTVFYLTDFGANVAGLPLRHIRYLQRWVPVWQQYYSRSANMDLLSEMIMVGRCIVLEESASSWQTIQDTQDPSGAIPSPLAKDWTDSLAGDAAKRHFFSNYHTTLVTVMAAAMALGTIRQRMD
jgi:hypothetical protein